jgi:hypothetical protein
MTFQDFLQFKTAQAIVEHIETLSDAEAREFVDQLDEQTVGLIEAMLNEITAGTMQKVKARVDRGELPRSVLEPVQQMYRDRPRKEEGLVRMFSKGFSPKERRKMRRQNQQADAEMRRERSEGVPEQRTPGDATNRLRSIYDPALAPTNNREQQRDFERDTMRGFR